MKRGRGPLAQNNSHFLRPAACLRATKSPPPKMFIFSVIHHVCMELKDKNLIWGDGTVFDSAAEVQELS